MTKGDSLNTIIKNAGILFTPDPRYCRWFTPRELFLAQGFPMYQSINEHNLLMSFDVPREDHKLPPRTRTSMVEQCGNAMHVHVIGLAMLYPFLYLILRPLGDDTEPSGDPDAAGSAPEEEAPVRKRLRVKTRMAV